MWLLCSWNHVTNVKISKIVATSLQIQRGKIQTLDDTLEKLLIF
jgi:hypothetical protein